MLYDILQYIHLHIHIIRKLNHREDTRKKYGNIQTLETLEISIQSDHVSKIISEKIGEDMRHRYHLTS